MAARPPPFFLRGPGFGPGAVVDPDAEAVGGAASDVEGAGAAFCRASQSCASSESASTSTSCLMRRGYFSALSASYNEQTHDIGLPANWYSRVMVILRERGALAVVGAASAAIGAAAGSGALKEAHKSSMAAPLVLRLASARVQPRSEGAYDASTGGAAVAVPLFAFNFFAGGSTASSSASSSLLLLPPSSPGRFASSGTKSSSSSSSDGRSSFKVSGLFDLLAADEAFLGPFAGALPLLEAAMVSCRRLGEGEEGRHR